MENLGCANCAAKMESKFNAHPLVEEATIVFSTRQLRLTAQDPDALIPELQELARTVEGGIVIRPREEREEMPASGSCGCGCGGHQEHHSCGCGCHEEDHGCGCGGHCGHECTCGNREEQRESMPEETVLGYSAVLFAAGLVMDHFGMLGLSLVCCVIAYIMLGRQILKTAVTNIVKGRVFDENFLMSVATLG